MDRGSASLALNATVPLGASLGDVHHLRRKHARRYLVCPRSAEPACSGSAARRIVLHRRLECNSELQQVWRDRHSTRNERCHRAGVCPPRGRGQSADLPQLSGSEGARNTERDEMG